MGDQAVPDLICALDDGWKVLRVGGRGHRGGHGSQATIRHGGSSNFVVSAWGSSWDLLVNEIGNYSGTVRVPAGTVIFEVQADGNWTIDQG